MCACCPVPAESVGGAETEGGAETGAGIEGGGETGAGIVGRAGTEDQVGIEAGTEDRVGIEAGTEGVILGPPDKVAAVEVTPGDYSSCPWRTCPQHF